MTEQYLRWSVNSNCCSRRKTRLLRVEILSWGPWTDKNKYPNFLKVFALRGGPSRFLMRSLRLISRYKYQLVFIFRTFELYLIGYYWNSLQTFGIHFLIIILFNTTLRQYFKDCNVFQRVSRQICERTLPFMPKRSNEIIYLPKESFSCLKFCHFPLLSKML